MRPSNFLKKAVTLAEFKRGGNSVCDFHASSPILAGRIPKTRGLHRFEGRCSRSFESIKRLQEVTRFRFPDRDLAALLINRFVYLVVGIRSFTIYGTWSLSL